MIGGFADSWISIVVIKGGLHQFCSRSISALEMGFCGAEIQAGIDPWLGYMLKDQFSACAPQIAV
jgi:hypothetical protein